LYGKSVLSKAIEKGVGAQVQDFLREKGAIKWVIYRVEALELSQGFWSYDGYLKSLEEIKELLKKGAVLEAKDKDGRTALIRAASRGDIEGVKTLAECGADVEAKDGVGQTALIKVAINGKLDVVKCLVECGADLEAKDGVGRTALMEAAYNNHLEVVKYFAECGADVNASAEYGHTALDIAKKMKRDDCVKFLEELQQKGEPKVEILSGEEKNTTVKKRGIWQRIFGGRD
ncbi:MAG: ankyrin repeat domain-containing protein, partial [Alphaproteobacteria bacterium]|nr:ankyrin repeat domain-containing protein [Alphaproteobacteria bacterium]